MTVPPDVAQALRTNTNLTLTEYQAADMEWYAEVQAIRDAFQSGQTAAKQTAAAIAAEIG